jgi:hypothetical protein
MFSVMLLQCVQSPFRFVITWRRSQTILLNFPFPVNLTAFVVVSSFGGAVLFFISLLPSSLEASPSVDRPRAFSLFLSGFPI